MKTPEILPPAGNDNPSKPPEVEAQGAKAALIVYGCDDYL